jgi:hypothetical protein
MGSIGCEHDLSTGRSFQLSWGPFQGEIVRSKARFSSQAWPRPRGCQASWRSVAVVFQMFGKCPWPPPARMKDNIATSLNGQSRNWI